MDEAKLRWLAVKIEKILDHFVTGSNDITVILLRCEGKEVTQVDVDRHLSRPH